MNLLLLMTTGMSLKRWNELGQLSRELNIYQKLGEKLGHIYIFSYGKNEDKYVRDYPNISIITKWAWFPSFPVGKRYENKLYQFLSLVFRKKLFLNIDVIKTNQFNGGEFGLKIKRKFNHRLFVRMGFYHTYDNNRFEHEKIRQNQIKLEAKIFPYCDGILVTNKIAQKYIKDNYEIKQVHFIPNMIDTDKFMPIDIEKDIDVLFVGRLIPVKNLFVLLEAVKDTGYVVTFIGKGEPKEALLKYARDNKINLTVIDKIENDELPKYYNRAKIFVLISKYEGNPKVLLEAMACGCICLGSDVNDINNIIRHKINGYLCNIEKDSLKEAIDEVLNNGHSQSSIGENAQYFIEENYSMGKLITREIDIYRALQEDENG